jgi:hypothetical protein
VERQVLHRPHASSDAARLDTSSGVPSGSQPFGKISEVTSPPSKARDHYHERAIAMGVKFDGIAISVHNARCWHETRPREAMAFG